MNNLYNMIDEIADAFYQQKDKDGYEQLNELIGQLLSINNPNINEKLVLAMKALEKKDTVLLADILKYEVKNVLG